MTEIRVPMTAAIQLKAAFSFQIIKTFAGMKISVTAQNTAILGHANKDLL